MLTQVVTFLRQYGPQYNRLERAYTYGYIDIDEQQEMGCFDVARILINTITNTYAVYSPQELPLVYNSNTIPTILPPNGIYLGESEEDDIERHQFIFIRENDIITLIAGYGGITKYNIKTYTCTEFINTLQEVYERGNNKQYNLFMTNNEFSVANTVGKSLLSVFTICRVGNIEELTIDKFSIHLQGIIRNTTNELYSGMNDDITLVRNALSK